MIDDPTTRDMLELLRGRFFGKYRGVVASILPDPTLRGRIQVIVPAVLGETIVWAMPCVPYAGRNVGFHMLPAIGAGVWVEFEAGDPSYPIWSGCYWAQGEVPVIDGLSTVKFIRTEKLTLRIDDALGEIVIQTLTGSRITINAKSIKIQAIDIKAASGARNISIDPASVSTNDGAHEVF
jgi:hypothetical protein